jgi:hypothetical protein
VSTIGPKVTVVNRFLMVLPKYDQFRHVSYTTFIAQINISERI